MRNRSDIDIIAEILNAANEKSGLEGLRYCIGHFSAMHN
jgi:hypothetical protein